jgi:hypothetical protein
MAMKVMLCDHDGASGQTGNLTIKVFGKYTQA